MLSLHDRSLLCLYLSFTCILDIRHKSIPIRYVDLQNYYNNKSPLLKKHKLNIKILL